MTSHFCGIPCTAPNSWELIVPSSALDGNTLDDPNHVSGSGVAPRLQSLDFYADFYNEHHACCFPRTLLDTHLGHAAQEVDQRSLSLKVESDDCGYLNSTAHEEGDASIRFAKEAPPQPETRAAIDHVIPVVEQLYRAQQERPPRTPMTRRIAYHAAVPPVLRCSYDSGAFVYTLTGQMVLQHRCHLSGGYPTAAHQCKHAHNTNAVARDVFPFFLVMSPSAECAAYVDGETATATAASEWRAQPKVLALESIVCKAETTRRHSESRTASEQSSANKDIVWYATYSPFTWMCHPLGNEHASGSKSARAASTRTRAKTRSGRASRKHSGGAVGSQGNSTTGAVQQSPELPPLVFQFEFYAALFTSEAAKEHVLTEMAARQHFSPSATRVSRFALGKTGNSADEAATTVSDEELKRVRQRRVGQLVRLLDSKISISPSSAPKPITATTSTAVSGREFDSTARGEGCLREGGSPPHKRQCQRHDTGPFSVVAAAESPASATPQNSVMTKVPCVQTTHLATLRTACPLAREVCKLPKGTTLVSVLPRKASSGVGAEGVKLEGENPRDQQSIHVALYRGDDAVSIGTTLSHLHTLEDLANALRRLRQ